MRTPFLAVCLQLLVSGCGGDGPCGAATTVTGNLTITNASDLDAARCVGTVTGDIDVIRTQLTEVRLPALTTVGGTIFIDMNDLLTAVHVPLLKTVQADIVLQIAFDLVTLSAPNLTSIGGDLHTADIGLTTVDLGSLTTVGTLNMKTLKTPTLSFPALTTVTSGVAITDNSQSLTALSMPMLGTIGGELRLMFDSGLASLDGFPALTSVGTNFNVSNNMALPTCAADALRDQLLAAGGIGGTVSIQNNDDSGTCI